MTHALRTALAFILLFALAVTTLLAQKPAPADVQLKAAITKETVDGDLKAAIEMYRTLAKGADRVVAAKALLRMGQCYEKLGDTESRKAYEQLVREFGDQKDVVDQARARLAALGGSKGGATVSVAKVSDTEALAISGDGRFVADGASGEMGRPGTPRPVLTIRDLVRGDDRVLLLRKEAQGWVEAGAAFSPPTADRSPTRGSAMAQDFSNCASVRSTARASHAWCSAATRTSPG